MGEFFAEKFQKIFRKKGKFIRKKKRRVRNNCKGPQNKSHEGNLVEGSLSQEILRGWQVSLYRS